MREEDLARAVMTDHAAFEMKRRGLDESKVRRVIASPEQRAIVRAGRIVLQSRLAMGSPSRMILIRVFVDVDPPEVVTAYRTGKISRYWRGEP